MTGTIKEQLLAAMLAKFTALPGYGLVVDAADAEPAKIAQQLALGKYAFEIIVGDDERVDGGPISKEQFEFDYFIVFYLPAPPPDRTSSGLAAGMHGELYKAFAANETVWTQGGFALRTELVGGGGAGIDPETRAVQGFTHLRLTYRHAVGDPTVG